MSIRNNYSHTIKACCIGYVTQAIAINFPPLLFLTFQSNYGVSLKQLSALIIITFLIQIGVDLLSTKFVDKIGYRKCTVAAHLFAAAGFILLGILPDVFPSAYAGILTACLFYSIGSGMLEVLVSPIVESCPTKHKASVMGLLHSFYSWGAAAVILLSTVFFFALGIENWRIMSMLWAILPLANVVLFLFVPIVEPAGEEKGGGLLALFKTKILWVLIVLMLCAGAAEQAMAQWASAFAESGLGVSKTIGDVAGPFMFALAMAIGRVVYSALVKKMDLMLYMAMCSGLCIVGYLIAALCPISAVALAGCALVGLAVGVFWPGSYSFGTYSIPKGGTALFAILAFAGDMGCSTGPAIVGFISSAFSDNLKTGLLASIIFPAVLLVFGILLREKKK